MDYKKKISLISVIIIGFFILIGIVLVAIFNPEEYEFFPQCILYQTTGLKCAGCGMTRAMHYLFTGNIKKAIGYNIMIIPLIIVISYSLFRYIMYIIKDEQIVNKKLERILKIFLVSLIIFIFVRNIIKIWLYTRLIEQNIVK